MPKLETIVRPVVFPNIRPAPPRVLPRENDPDKGFAVIRGNPATHIDLPYSYSMNATSTRTDEIERCSELVRVYQKDKDGKVNKDNYVDLEVANKIVSKGAKGPQGDDGKPFVAGVPKDTAPAPTISTARYKKVKKADNLEILDPHVCVRTNLDEPEDSGDDEG